MTLNEKKIEISTLNLPIYMNDLTKIKNDEIH